MTAIIIATISDEEIFLMVVSENSTLFIYQNTLLKWSAKLQLLPVCVKRVFLQGIQGSIVLLSEEGQLDCSYLGTNPILYIVPTLVMRKMDLQKIEPELFNLNERGCCFLFYSFES